MISATGHAIGGPPRPPVPEAIILVLAPFGPLFSDRVWCPAQVLLLGVMLAPGARTVTTAVRVLGLAAERRFTNDHRVLKRAIWSARQGSRLLLGLVSTLVVPPGATSVLGADDTGERRAGRKSRAKGGYRAAVRSSHTQVIRCCGRNWVAMRRVVPVPWRRRVWALPFRTALCGPAESSTRRRPTTSGAGVRQMMQQVRRGLPGRWPVSNTRGRCAVASCATQRESCGGRRSSVPMCRLRPCRSCRGS